MGVMNKMALPVKSRRRDATRRSRSMRRPRRGRMLTTRSRGHWDDEPLADLRAGELSSAEEAELE
jgi:hypothetical protein